MKWNLSETTQLQCVWIKLGWVHSIGNPSVVLKPSPRSISGWSGLLRILRSMNMAVDLFFNSCILRCLTSYFLANGKGVTSEFGATREPFSSCYICHQLLPVTTSHYQSLPVLLVATSRYQLLPVATSCYQCFLLVAATGRYQSLQVDTSWQCFFSVAATGRYQSLQVEHKLTMFVLIASSSRYQLLL